MHILINNYKMLKPANAGETPSFNYFRYLHLIIYKFSSI